MAQPSFNSKNPTIKRILKEAQELSQSPSPDYHASPLETNLFEWHFTLRGPPAPSPFADGLYHGRIVLPPTYPLRPPSFRFLTPSGRFEVNREICLSISGHHEESWQPAWGLRTALVALRSFMETEAKGQVGGVEATKEVRVRLAGESKSYRCTGCGGKTNEEIILAVEEAAEDAGSAGESSNGASSKDVVPQELKLGYRDEMQGVSPTDTEANSGEKEDRPAVAESPTSPKAVSSAPSAARSSPQDQGARESTGAARSSSTSLQESPMATSVSIPTAQIPTPMLASLPYAQSQQSPFPPWLDTAIAGVAIGLAWLLLRKFLAES